MLLRRAPGAMESCVLRNCDSAAFLPDERNSKMPKHCLKGVTMVSTTHTHTHMPVSKRDPT
jgi:hypothetical protein